MKSKSKEDKPAFKKLLPRIVIRFQNFPDLPYTREEEIHNYFLKGTLIPWKELLGKFPGITINKLFTSLSPGQIKELVRKIRKSSPKYKPPNFLACYAIDCNKDTDTEKLLSILLSNKSVEDAYIESDLVPPACIFTGTNPMIINQGYLNPARQGVDARYAWNVNGGCGEGRVKLIDIEPGWILDHEDIVGSGVSLLWGVEDPDWKYHGAGVLGIILMQDNNQGGVGITPKSKVDVIAQLSPNGRNAINDAIMAAIDNLRAGDILLLEAQYTQSEFPRRHWPVEVKSMTFDLIETATAKGIIVVEPAGNGSFDEELGNNLDEYSNRSNKKVLDETSDDFKDSGAIMVAAASESDSHGRIASSNYGNRIDCFAWGSDVYTAGESQTTYNPGFGGTSSASAIIAGVAIAVQSIVEASGRSRLTPAQLRDILSNDLYGTTSRSRIGVMPDLKKIIDNALPLIARS